MEMATGIPCIRTNTEPSTAVKLKSRVIRRANVGNITILNRLNLKAFVMFVYFLPYRKTPSMKMATVEVVFPSMRSGAEN